jgi:hypothetical protein
VNQALEDDFSEKFMKIRKPVEINITAYLLDFFVGTNTFEFKESKYINNLSKCSILIYSNKTGLIPEDAEI